MPTLTAANSQPNGPRWQALYTLFAQVATPRSRNPLLAETVQPLLKKVLALLEASFGPAAAWTPSVTHILLVAILIVLLARRE